MANKNSPRKMNVEKIKNIFCEKLLQNVDVPTMVTDVNGDMIFANKEFLYFFCFTKKDIMGKCWIRKLIPEKHQKMMKRIFGRIKKIASVVRFDSPLLVVGDPENYMRWLVVPLMEKKFSGYIFIGRALWYTPNSSVKVYPVTSKNLYFFYQEIIEILFAAYNAGEPGTAKHAYRVRAFSIALAKKMRLDKKRIERLKVASLLHDIGKLAIDDNILYKKGKLTKNEFKEIKKHPYCGKEIVNFIYFLKDILPIVESHHEKYAGGGYPNGIKGKDIPIEARILCVADIYEALTADRPYRKGFPKEEAIKIMEEEKGVKLDPRITDIFLNMARRGELKEDSI